ncbi:LPS-assembly protein LptD [Rhodoferax sp.]|uniref:LPS-assembly protein LptD n=1 Tax=Rhodoferax sp. TaxID=50421 RepID=UPI00374D9E81
MPEFQRSNRPGRFALTPVALLAATLCALLSSPVVYAVDIAADAAADDAPLVLKPSPLLNEQVPPALREQSPTFFSGEHTLGRPDLDTVIDGNAMMRKADMVMQADRVEYYEPDDTVKARGNVRINRAGNIYEGPALQLKVDAFEGFFTQPRYQFLKNGAYGEADQAVFVDSNQVVLHNATYSTCRRQPGPSWLPDWVLRATSISIDTEEEVGVADGAVLRFKDVPIMAFPAMSFPLTDKRKSGYLPPTIGIDNVNGVELTVPYYWNIAPNRDATFFPTVMSKRGVDLGGEFRYLEPDYRGVFRGDYMPEDSLRSRSRWGYALTHTGSIDTGLSGVGKLGLTMNLNRVSDDDYWSDFGRASTSLTQRLLANDVNLTWGRDNLSLGLRTLKYQTLQSVTSPIVPPYDRLPQITARYARYSLPGGLDASVDGDYTSFSADRTLTGQPNAKRSYVLGQISRPWVAPGWFLTPKMQLHATRYEFDAPLSTGATTADRTVPTFSLDSGLVFERDASFWGKALRQTLEPRAFYVNTPYRNQSALPNYDSALNDFNFATIFTENAFGGNDRISDSNLLTLGMTTRFLEPESGAELAQFGIAQRLRFKDQNVTLPGGAAVTDRLSDVLVGTQLNLDPRWSFNTTVQYNPKTSRSEQSSVGGRWNPGNYRVISANYRYQRGTSEQIDVGWQWPLSGLWGDKDQNMGPGQGLGPGRWYSVGRMNYSMYDRKLVDAVLGFEYDACCWMGRIVLDRTQTSTSTASQKISFQLEFVGFTRLGVGTNPLSVLKENIPRYQYLREQTTSPSRFSQYD